MRISSLAVRAGTALAAPALVLALASACYAQDLLGKNLIIGLQG